MIKTFLVILLACLLGLYFEPSAVDLTVDGSTITKTDNILPSTGYVSTVATGMCAISIPNGSTNIAVGTFCGTQTAGSWTSVNSTGTMTFVTNGDPNYNTICTSNAPCMVGGQK